MIASRLAPALFVTAALLSAGCHDVDSTAGAPDTANPLVEARIDVVRERIEASNAHDWDTWESLHTEDAVRTAPELPAPLEGANEMRAGIEELVVTFPDYHLELVEAFGQGDRLMARIHTKATMLGPMTVGETVIPPTGKVFEQDWIAVFRFEGDEIAAIDEFHDNYGILLQLGLAPSF
jgi:ketosteroid isomerase-like protein